MRPFDIAGIVFVAAWVIAIAAFATMAEDGDPTGISIEGGVIDLQEQTRWMRISHREEQIGVLRKDRTRLLDGWLVELQGIVELDQLGNPYRIRFHSRSNLDEKLILQSASGGVEAFGMELEMNGYLRDTDDGARFEVHVNLDGASEQFVADLGDSPRLATHAIPKILATEDLEVGDHFEQEFFDPLTLAPTNLEITYKGRESIRTVGEVHDGHDFAQSVGQFDMRMITDDSGMVISQAFPMGITAHRLHDQTGPAQYRNFAEDFDDTDADPPPFVDHIDARDLLSLVARFGSGEIDRLQAADAEDLVADLSDDSTDSEVREVDIDMIPDDADLDLVAPRQHVATESRDDARVETGAENPLWSPVHAPDDSTYESVADSDNERVSELAEAIADTGALDDAESFDPSAIGGAVVDGCGADIADAQSADFDAPWPDDASEVTSYVDCLRLTADALSALDRPPHFIHGAVADGDIPQPRVWLGLFSQYEHIGAIDPLADGGAPGPDHLQLYVDDRYDADTAVELSDHLSFD